MKNAIHLNAFCFFLAFYTLCQTMPFSSAIASGATPYDDKSATIYVYHRIGEDPYPETSIRKSQFEAHIHEILSGGYNVIALTELVHALKEGLVLPEKTIALTFDGGHKSVLRHAVPLLAESGIPFTVFFSTNKADLNSEKYLNWRDLKNLSNNKNVSFGLHPATYDRLSEKTESRLREQINRAKARFREKLGMDAKLFAYPFGEYGKNYRQVIQESGFTAAFGQQSSVAWSGSDIFELPRFTMTESFADLGRFTLTANALPLPVTDIEPKDKYINEEVSSAGFTLHPALTDGKENLSCFISEPGQIDIEFLGEGRVELRGMGEFASRRIRINCTMPGPETEEAVDMRWRWFGMLLTVSEDYLGRHPKSLQADDAAGLSGSGGENGKVSPERDAPRQPPE